MTNAPYPDINTIENWFPVDPSQNNSEINDYIDTINSILLGFYKTGAYGGAWGSVDLPSTPSGGKWCIRVNTDDSNNMRLYVYNDQSTAWEYVAFT